MFARVAAAAAAFVFLPAATAPADPAAAFGARESVEEIRLSPDGSKIAYLSPLTKQGSALFVVDLATGVSKVAATANGDPQRLHSCDWVSNARLVCTVWAMQEYMGEYLPMARVFAADADGTNMKLLSQPDSPYQLAMVISHGGVIDWLPDEEGAVLMTRVYVPELKENSRLKQTRDGVGVERIDTRSRSAKMIEVPREEAQDFITDGRGNVRMMGVQPTGATGMIRRISYSYRTKTSRQWRSFGDYDMATDEGMYPLAVDPALDAAYVIQKTNGRDALYRVALDGTMRKELVFQHPQVDVGSLMRIGRRNRVVGVSFSTEKQQTVYFDPELKQLAAALSKALPNLPLVQFIDADADESKLLVFAGSDTDPGRYYIYDKTTRNLAEIMLKRPELEGVKLAEVKPVSYKASDGTMVPAYLTLPPGSSGKGLPAIVMPHGGPSARDEWGFDWLPQYFANRGYAVIQPNYRGSAGFGDDWYKENGFKSWRAAVQDVNDAGRWLVAQGIADSSKLAIVGASYGGYAALQSNVIDPGLFKAIVAWAPVTDLAMLKEQSRHQSDFALARDFIGSGAHIKEGSPAQNAGAIRAPVLMFHGDLDRNVEIKQSRHMKNKLAEAGKQVELIVYPKLDHYLEDSAARKDMLSRSDAFLRQALKL